MIKVYFDQVLSGRENILCKAIFETPGDDGSKSVGSLQEFSSVCATSERAPILTRHEEFASILVIYMDAVILGIGLYDSLVFAPLSIFYHSSHHPPPRAEDAQYHTGKHFDGVCPRSSAQVRFRNRMSLE